MAAVDTQSMGPCADFLNLSMRQPYEQAARACRSPIRAARAEIPAGDMANDTKMTFCSSDDDTLMTFTRGPAPAPVPDPSVLEIQHKDSNLEPTYKLQYFNAGLISLLDHGESWCSVDAGGALQPGVFTGTLIGYIIAREAAIAGEYELPPHIAQYLNTDYRDLKVHIQGMDPIQQYPDLAVINAPPQPVLFMQVRFWFTYRCTAKDGSDQQVSVSRSMLFSRHNDAALWNQPPRSTNPCVGMQMPLAADPPYSCHSRS